MRAWTAVLSLLLLLAAATTTDAMQNPATVTIELNGDTDQPPLPEAQSLDDAELDKACPPRFTREYWPVCGFDGATYKKYANKSIFAYHQCRAQKLHGVTMTLVDMRWCPDDSDAS
ncbi:Kazal-like serine protease inhibitor domain-containing protein, partial [Globisporangium splendens]